jgi:hypothetical protein
LFKEAHSSIKALIRDNRPYDLAEKSTCERNRTGNPTRRGHQTVSSSLVEVDWIISHVLRGS